MTKQRLHSRGILSALGTLPATAVALLPSFTCPACLAAYTGFLSALGVGFVLNERILSPLIALFLVLGIYSVRRAARSHKRRGPLLVTVLASILVVMGRLIWTQPVLLYLGSAMLISATLWNLWLKRPRRALSTAPVTPGGCQSFPAS